MSFTVSIIPGKQFSPNEAVDNAKLNQLGSPTASITGTGAGNDFADGAVAARKTTAGPFFYADNGSTYGASGIGKTGKYRTVWNINSPPDISGGLLEGTVIVFRATADNQGSVSLDWLNAIEYPLYKFGSIELVRGDIVNGQLVEIRFYNGAWRLMSNATLPKSWYQGTDSGAANAYIVNLTPPDATVTSIALADIVGKPIRFKAATANTGASTLQVSVGTAVAFLAKPIQKAKNVALIAGDIKAGQIVEVVYEATGDNFQMQSQTGNPSPNVVIGVDAGATDSYAITSTPTIGAYTDGLTVIFRANTVNTGAATMAVNSLAAIAIVSLVGNVLKDGMIAAGQWVTLVYDATTTKFQMLSRPAAWASVLSANDCATKVHTLAHGLGIIPSQWYFRLVCIDAGGDAGYSLNDEADPISFAFNSGGNVTNVFGLSADSTNLTLSMTQNFFNVAVNKAGATNYPTANATNTATTTKWKPKAYFYV